jgi:hypothetical protein
VSGLPDSHAPRKSFRPALIKVRVYEGQEDLWKQFLREGGGLTPTGYRDGSEGEFVLGREAA